ncbi:hypothetical protein C4K03_2410 [Pseudomonas synxantha]|uniref:Ubiquitin-like domain-containing protein n=1 Tax=Pseudomonas synxantha TaxID=47883 RepID=A0A3G7U5J1_9PSED|nr:hypothetical protein C4K03_2410 [Pseudomonas synxantha]
MIIYVEITPSDTISLDVQSTDTIKTVKEHMKAENEMFSPPFLLYLANTLLDDGRTLSSYNVGTNAKLRFELDQDFKVLK